jgi:multidrug transporter EmrE-like cation transporter
MADGLPVSELVLFRSFAVAALLLFAMAVSFARHLSGLHLEIAVAVSTALGIAQCFLLGRYWRRIEYSTLMKAIGCTVVVYALILALRLMS